MLIIPYLFYMVAFVLHVRFALINLHNSSINLVSFSFISNFYSLMLLVLSKQYFDLYLKNVQLVALSHAVGLSNSFLPNCKIALN